MEPYQIHVGDWTVKLYSTDKDERLTFTVTNKEEESNYLTRLEANVSLKRHFIGTMCAGTLHSSPFMDTQIKPSNHRPLEALLADQGCG